MPGLTRPELFFARTRVQREKPLGSPYTCVWEILAGNGPKIDAVVLDCRIPGEPSAQLALHAKSMRLPVVMISGHVGTMQFAAENGLQLLRKPFHMADLLNAVREAIASGEFGQRAA
jgi:FixJ family two-component response regulator